ncbi:Thioesterase superfamily [Macleaya cordata]|uniref:Acyl-coenzyme A thioesterase 13 n=1 Tax=Macleaya cordata TaxID=56857 RepID=A0A200R4R0_MACCD|nr:Thioesterase superfamily [Macleaya cordata]
MEKAREVLELTKEEAESVSRLTVYPHRVGFEKSFFEDFALGSIRVDRVEPGLVSCTFKVPPRLTDGSGNLSKGAIASLVDEIGAAAVHVDGHPMKVSVDMSISYLSTAKANDELEITSRGLGQKRGYFGTIVLLKNKGTGEVIAEGRHSLFCKIASKI